MDICELLPTLAKMGEKYPVVRSLFHNRNDTPVDLSVPQGLHAQGRQSGRPRVPRLGSVVAKQLEDQVDDIPLFVANTKFYGAVRLTSGGLFGFYAQAKSITSSGANRYDPAPLFGPRTANCRLGNGFGRHFASGTPAVGI
ncbi:MAG: hypothetical protein Ct9H300mP1_08620 [Planctomycetaceae bacterium]|nr:MAG: hypothetical protein Ct9H300mP1_08620 [Planctomycetaceae bacterium]